MIKFTIPFRLPSLNEYINKINQNRHVGNRFKQETEDQIIWILKGLKYRIQRPVNIKITWYEQTKRRDKDNVMSAKKFIFDAMQKAGTLPNDNNEYILHIQENIIYGQGDKVEVEIEEG